MGYSGYFKSLDNKSYRVDIASGGTEIKLAGTSPFTVNYDISTTPFDELRTSKATIQVVHNDYLFDIMSEQAQGTSVDVYDITTTPKIVWKGYLKPNLYNQGYTQEWETIELEASDCLCSLQYIDYKVDRKEIRTFHQLLSDICTKAGLNGFYITTGKLANGNPIDFNQLKISDKNFFSSDTTETPWKYDEVLSEMCKYLGYTALQWGEYLYLIDLQAYHSQSSFIANYWLKSETYSTKHTTTLGTTRSIVKDSYRGNNANISLDAIYNKVKVKANFYDAEEILPKWFDDELIENTAGNKYACNIIPTPDPAKASYINEKNKVTMEEKADNVYTYLEKTWRNSKYISHQYDADTYGPVSATYSYRVVTVDPVMDPQWGIRITGYNVKMGYRNNTSSAITLTVTLVCDSLTTTKTINLPAYSTLYDTIGIADDDVTVYSNPELTIVCGGQSSTFFPQPMKDFDNKVISATLVEFGSVGGPTVSKEFYETESDVNFKQYLKISCADKPAGRLSPSGLTPEQIETYYPSLFELTSGYTCPIVADNNCFLVINATAINERYDSRPYINPDWSAQGTGLDGEYNYHIWDQILGDFYIYSTPPSIVLKLGFGNKWWNGTTWQNTECAFFITLGMDTTDDLDPDYSKLWNTDHKVLNNVNWTEWAGVSGYKVPLAGVNTSDELHFEVLLPGKVQNYTGTTTITPSFNSFFWISDFNVKVGTKGGSNFSNSDVLYENIISSGSTNEMSEISVKFTTKAGQGNLSYSTVGYGNGFLSAITDTFLVDTTPRVPEEIIIQRYVEQYSTPTKREELPVDMSFTPFDKVIDTYWNQNFVVLGQSIDYADGSQQITIMQKK